MNDPVTPTIEVFGVTMTQDHLAAFLETIPGGTRVEFRGSVFNGPVGLDLDKWPNLELIFIGNAFMGDTNE